MNAQRWARVRGRGLARYTLISAVIGGAIGLAESAIPWHEYVVFRSAGMSSVARASLVAALAGPPLFALGAVVIAAAIWYINEKIYKEKIYKDRAHL